MNPLHDTIFFVALEFLTVQIRQFCPKWLQVADSPSWHARAAILLYIQVMVFCNLFLLQEEHVRSQIQELVLTLLCDEQLEVSPCVLSLALHSVRACPGLFCEISLNENKILLLPRVRIKCAVHFQVREAAHVTLGGFLHCGYLTMGQDMMVSECKKIPSGLLHNH